MTHQNVDGTIQCEVRYFLQNNNAANVFHVRATGPITSALLDSLFDVINTWLTEVWAPIAGAGWTANQVILTGLNSLFDPRKAYALDPPIAGSAAAQALAANVTLAVKEDVGRRGRGIAGRWFWIGLAEDQVDGNIVATAAAGDVLTALNTLAEQVATTAGLEGLAVPHLVVDHGRPNPAVSDVITGFQLTDNSIDTQKNRLPFHKKRKLKTVA